MVGGMKFDPIRMSWYALDSSTEEPDLELSFSPSEISSCSTSPSSSTFSIGGLGRKGNDFFGYDFGVEEGDEGLREECRIAEERHEREMKSWRSNRGNHDEEEVEWDQKREGLWEIRRLVLDSRSP